MCPDVKPSFLSHFMQNVIRMVSCWSAWCDRVSFTDLGNNNAEGVVLENKHIHNYNYNFITGHNSHTRLLGNFAMYHHGFRSWCNNHADNVCNSDLCKHNVRKISTIEIVSASLVWYIKYAKAENEQGMARHTSHSHPTQFNPMCQWEWWRQPSHVKQTNESVKFFDGFLRQKQNGVYQTVSTHSSSVRCENSIGVCMCSVSLTVAINFGYENFYPCFLSDLFYL